MSIIASQVIGKISIEGGSQAKNEFRQVGQESDKAQRGLNLLKPASEEASSSLGGRLLGSLHSVAGGFMSTISQAGFFIGGLKSIAEAGIGLVGGLIAPNAALEQMRVSFKAFIPDASQLAATLAGLKKFAAVTPYESDEVNKSALSLLNMDVQAQDLTKWLGNVGAAVSKVGGSGQVFEDVTAIISQMGVKGKVTTEEMQQLTDRNIPAFKILAQAMNVPVASLQDMISRGELGRDKIELLVQSMGKFGGDAMVEQGKTFNGLLSTLKDNATQALAAFTGPLFDAAKVALQDMGNLVSSDAFQNFATGAGQRVADVFGFIGQAAQYVANVLRTVDLSSFNEAWRNTQVLLQDIEGRISRGISPALKLLKTDADPVAQVIGNLAQGGLNVLSGILWSVEGGLMAVDRALATGKGPFGEFGEQAKTIAFLLGGQFVDSFKFAGQQASQISKWFQGSGIIKDIGQEFKNLVGITLNLAEIFTRARGVVVDVAEHAFAKFAPYIEKILPPLIKFGTAIDTGIGQALQYVKPYIEQALAAFEKFASGVIDRITPIIDKVLPYILLGVQEVAIGWNEIWPSLSAVLKGAWDIITGVIQIAWSLVSGIINVGLDVLSGNWGQAWDDIKFMFSGAWDGIKNIASGALNILKTIFSPIGQWFSDRFHEAWSGITGVFGNIGHWFSDRWNEVVNFTKTVIARMVDGFMVPFRAIGALFAWLYDHNKYFKMLIDAITGIVSTGVAWLQNAWKVSIDWIVGAWNDVVKFASDIWGKVSGAIHDGFVAAIGFVSSVWGSISSFFVNAWNDYIAGPLGTVWTNVSTFFSNIWTNYIAKPIGDLWTNISTTIGGWVDKAVTWGGNLIQGFVNGIVAKASNVAGAVGGIAQKVLEFLGFHSPTKEGPGREADQWAPNFIRMYTAGLRAGIPQIEGVVSRLVKPVSVSLNPSISSTSYMPAGSHVIPAAQTAQMMQGASSGGSGQPIYLQIDGKTFARLFMPHMVGAIRNNVGVRF